MPTYDHIKALCAAIDAELAVLQQQLINATDSILAPSQLELGRRFGDRRRALPPPDAQEIVVALDTRIGRLEMLRDMIDDDEQLAYFIDSMIGRRVRVAERRQVRLTVVLNVIFLIVGWLLSLIGTPANLAHIFGH